MIPQLDKTYLITVDNWFYAPDGQSYRAVFGTVKAIHTDEEALGIKTNRASTNWYVAIGGMMIAGCQIHYCIQADEVNYAAPIAEGEKDGKIVASKSPISRIYNADVEGL